VLSLEAKPCNHVLQTGKGTHVTYEIRKMSELLTVMLRVRATLSMSTVRGGGDRRASSQPPGDLESEKGPRGNSLEIVGGGGGSNGGRRVTGVDDCGRILPVCVRVGEGSSPR